MMDASQRITLREITRQATHGPWTTEPHGNTTALYSGRTMEQHGLRLLNLDDLDWNGPANVAFIAAVNPTVVNHLLDAADRADKLEATLRALLKCSNMDTQAWERVVQDARKLLGPA